MTELETIARLDDLHAEWKRDGDEVIRRCALEDPVRYCAIASCLKLEVPHGIDHQYRH